MSEKINTLLALAASMEQQGQFDEALKYYDLTLQEDLPPEARSATLFNRGNALANLSREDEAEQSYLEALRSVAPHVLPHILNNLTSLYLNAGRWLEAATCATEAIKRHPEVEILYINATRALFYVDRYAEAFQIGLQAYESSPNNPALLQALAMAKQDCDRMFHLLQEAQTTLQKAPEDVQAWHDKLLALLNLGQLDAFFEESEKVPANVLATAKFHSWTAGAWLARGKPQEALKAAEKALAIEPGGSAGYFRANALKVEALLAKIQGSD